jgi:hypothetical protein
MLCRSGSVDEFSKRFIALSCRDTTLSEPQQIQLFIMGLGDPLCTDVAQQQPASLDDVVIFTRIYEQHNVPREAATPQQTRSASCYTPRLAALPAATTTGATPAPSMGSVNKPATTSIRLSPSEIAWRRKDDKCFKCDEFFTPDHCKHCKQLFTIVVMDEEEADDLSPTTEEPTISLHALTGIQPRASRKMTLVVTVNNA